MRFKSIMLKNIRSYENQEIIFPEGSLLLSGDIGSGKTTILLAIEYALFGLQPGQKGSSLLRNATNSGEVSLVMEIEGKEVIIERKLKRSNKSIANEYAAITLDGEKIETSITELKTKILDLIGYPQEFVKKNNLLYRYTVYTPQEEMKQIINEDSETRLNILRHIFGIDKYKTIRENLQLFLTTLREETRFLQAELRLLDEEKVKINLKKQFSLELESRYKEKRESFKDMVAQRELIEKEVLAAEQKIKEREIFEREVEKTRILIGTKKESISSLNRDYIEIAQNITEFKESFVQEDYDNLVQDISSKKKEVEELNRRLIEVTSKLESSEEKISENLSKKDRIFGIGVCPTCLQDVTEVHKHNIKNEAENLISELKKSATSLKKEREDVINVIELKLVEITRLEEQKTRMEITRAKAGYLEQAKKRLEEIVKLRENLEKDAKLLTNHIDSLKEDILQFSRFTTLFRLKQDELKQSIIQERNAEITMAEVKKELELVLKEIEEIEQSVLIKEAKKRKLSDLIDLQDWLTNQFTSLVEFTERNVLLKLRREFSNLFNIWFHILAGESFEVQLDETFTPLIMQGEVEMDYSFLSGGERTSIALAYRLALNQIVNSVLSKIKTRDIVILDEPTDGFSDSQIDKMRDVLEQLAVEQLIIVSHEQKIENFVDNVLRLSKDGNVSVLDSTSLDSPNSSAIKAP